MTTVQEPHAGHDRPAAAAPGPDPGRGTASGHDAWRRPTAMAAYVVSAAALVLTALAGEVIPPLVVIAVLFTVLGTLVLRSPARWPRYTIAVLGVLVVAGNAPFVIADLSHPESIAGFGPTFVLLVALAVAGAGGIASARRSALAVPPVVIGALVLGVVGLLGSALAAFSLSDDEAQPGDVEIVAEDVEYPAELTVDAGTVGFLVDNADPVRHTFLIEGTDVAQELPGSTARRVEVDLGPGTYRYYCDVPGHEDMEGTLTVR